MGSDERGSAAPFCAGTANHLPAIPGRVLERNLAAARELGYDYRVAVEMEYYLLPGDGTLPDQESGAGYFSVGG